MSVKCQCTRQEQTRSVKLCLLQVLNKWTPSLWPHVISYSHQEDMYSFTGLFLLPYLPVSCSAYLLSLHANQRHVFILIWVTTNILAEFDRPFTRLTKSTGCERSKKKIKGWRWGLRICSLHYSHIYKSINVIMWGTQNWYFWRTEFWGQFLVCLCVRACVRACMCVRACVRVYVCACVWRFCWKSWRAFSIFSRSFFSLQVV